VQQSNAYIIGFSAGLTIILGGLLSLAAVLLKPIQDKEVKLDTQKQILSAVNLTEGKTKAEISDIYTQRIKSIAVNIDGEPVSQTESGDEVIPEDVNISKEYKKPPEERIYPVFQLMASDGNSIEAYIVPVYGFGLWDYIWGYVAIEPDLNTLRGVTFDHRGETPGLGARITTTEVQQRYQGKKLYDDGTLKSIEMMKSESNPNLTAHQVDGMSGATITAKGVNEMLKKYIKYYEPYFNTVKAS